MKKNLFVASIIAVALTITFTGMVLAYTLSWELQPWMGTNYVYTVTSDTALEAGQAICVQYKSNVDGWNYHQAECLGSGATWACTIPGPATGTGTTGYNYEFYAQTSGNCSDIGGGNSWTGEQWQETNSTTPVTLTSLTGSAPAALALFAGVATLGAVVVSRRRS